nr:MAG TPA_asm: hypothetical protein [Caudoviricetes sp.]
MLLLHLKKLLGVGFAELLFLFVLYGAIIIYVCSVCNSVCSFLFFLYGSLKQGELFVCFIQNLRSYATKQG